MPTRKNKNRKHILTIALAASILFVSILTACGSTDAPPEIEDLMKTNAPPDIQVDSNDSQTADPAENDPSSTELQDEGVPDTQEESNVFPQLCSQEEIDGFLNYAIQQDMKLQEELDTLRDTTSTDDQKIGYAAEYLDKIAEKVQAADDAPNGHCVKTVHNGFYRVLDQYELLLLAIVNDSPEDVDAYRVALGNALDVFHRRIKERNPALLP